MNEYIVNCPCCGEQLKIFIDSSDLEYRRVVVSSSMRTVTPGFNRIFGDPYVVKIERYIPYV